MSEVKLYRQKKNGKELPTWWIYYRRDGKTIRESLKTKDRAQAEAALTQVENTLNYERRNQLTEEVFRASRKLDAPHIDIESHFSNVRALLTNPRTQTEYEKVHNRFIRYIKAEHPKFSSLHEIAPSHAREWHLDLISCGLAPRTVNKHVRIVRGAFNQAKENGYIHINPLENIKMQKADKAKRRAFTEDELALIFKEADGFIYYTALLGLYTGARLGDITTLKWSDLDFRKKLICYQMSKKRGEPMQVPMHAIVIKEMKKLKTKQKPSPNAYIFPEEAELYNSKNGASRVSNKWSAFLGKIGLKKNDKNHYNRERRKNIKSGKATGKKTEARTPSDISFHCFRHTTVSLLKDMGTPESIARHIVGHDSESVSQLYTHVAEQSERHWVNAMPDFTEQPKLRIAK